MSRPLMRLVCSIRSRRSVRRSRVIRRRSSSSTLGGWTIEQTRGSPGRTRDGLALRGQIGCKGHRPPPGSGGWTTFVYQRQRSPTVIGSAVVVAEPQPGGDVPEGAVAPTDGLPDRLQGLEAVRVTGSV